MGAGCRRKRGAPAHAPPAIDSRPAFALCPALPHPGLAAAASARWRTGRSTSVSAAPAPRADGTRAASHIVQQSPHPPTCSELMIVSSCRWLISARAPARSARLTSCLPTVVAHLPAPSSVGRLRMAAHVNVCTRSLHNSSIQHGVALRSDVAASGAGRRPDTAKQHGQPSKAVLSPSHAPCSAPKALPPLFQWVCRAKSP